MKTRMAVSVLAALLAAGCATPISPKKLATADYGPPPPANYEEIVKARFSRVLIDPTSPIYEIRRPHKGYTKQSSLFDTQESFGWVVCGTVNSKNRMGGYTGGAPFFTLFKGGYIAEFVPGDTVERYSVANASIRKACNRTTFN